MNNINPYDSIKHGIIALLENPIVQSVEFTKGDWLGKPAYKATCNLDKGKGTLISGVDASLENAFRLLMEGMGAQMYVIEKAKERGEPIMFDFGINVIETIINDEVLD